VATRKQGEGAQRFAERRRLENEAPRLTSEVPDLRSLRLEISEQSGTGSVSAEPGHIRRIVVESAPALFVLTCGDLRCKDGGHDLTHPIMRALRAGQLRFEGEDACTGSLGSGQCERILRYLAIATFANR
jgi:hypothetical protein